MTKDNIIVVSVIGVFSVFVLVMFTYVLAPSDKKEVPAISEQEKKKAPVEYGIRPESKAPPAAAVQQAMTMKEEPALKSPLTQPLNTQNAEFRKEIFEKAHRAAVEYDAGDEVKLIDELDLIQSAVSGEKEGNAFKLFKLISEVQQDLVRLEGAKIATNNMASKFASYPENTKKTMISVKPEIAAFSQVKSLGGVVVSTTLDSKWAVGMSPLVMGRKLKTMETDGLTWISYESTKFMLLALEKALLETVGEVLNNNGNVR